MINTILSIFQLITELANEECISIIIVLSIIVILIKIIMRLLKISQSHDYIK